MRAVSSFAALLLVAAWPRPVLAQDAKTAAMARIDANKARYEAAALRIWELAEVGYQEVESAALLQSLLREAQFDVRTGTADIPTAFVASWGQGKPVIAILAEYDALPGITQEAVPQRKPREDKTAGHACGHHLFGVGSVAAAIAVRDWMAQNRITGTLRLYGTPAEEGGSGKVYIARSGALDDVDAVLHWHASDRNDAGPYTSLANVSAKFRFHGLSAHAAGFPERGRSALDGVEAMNHMVNLMREHVPQETRIHYVITRGGEAPNVVPDFAEVYYYVRHPLGTTVHELFQRILKAAEGAALGTGTTVEHEIIGGVYQVLPNETLARAMDTNLRRVGGMTYDARELAFAQELHKSFPPDALAIGSEATIAEFREYRSGGSTDVGDVSWRVPTAGLRTATWVPGTASHSWQAVAAGGTSIGIKGMIIAAKTLALTAMDAFTQPSLLAGARAEFQRRIPPGFVYRALLGDRAPALDYRK
jgi:aminobenzoyl-glutamate utilization protein B